MTDLAADVLPLIRTRAELHRPSAANAHGRQMHKALDILRAAAAQDDPAAVFAVTQKAIASAVKVILRADDSSGIIGDAVRGLLSLHAELAAVAKPPAARLVAWMIAFQFDGEQDFFEIDPAAYAPALGERGIALYRGKLDEIATGPGPAAADEDSRAEPGSHTRFLLAWNARRLAVLDRDVDAIIRTHARDRKVAAWLQDTAEALAEIGEIDFAIDWARQATDFGPGHQSRTAAEYWCDLLATHRPADLLAARQEVFRRWPSADSAGRLYTAAGPAWPDHRDQVFQLLAEQPRDAVLFALLSLQDVELAWNQAIALDLRDADAWERLAESYETVDPLAVLPVLADLVDGELTRADARSYRSAARHLAAMRRLAAGSVKATDVDLHIAELRQAHRNRPRLQVEFDRAGLP